MTRFGPTKEERLDNGRAVDGVTDRLPDARVGEEREVQVEREEPPRDTGDLLRLIGGVGGEGLVLIGCDEREVHAAGLEIGDQRRRIGNGPGDDRVQFRRSGEAIRESAEGDPLALPPLFDHERTGIDRFLREWVLGRIGGCHAGKDVLR